MAVIGDVAVGSRVVLAAEVVGVFYPDRRWVQIAITPGPEVQPVCVWVHAEILSEDE